MKPRLQEKEFGCRVLTEIFGRSASVVPRGRCSQSFKVSSNSS